MCVWVLSCLVLSLRRKMERARSLYMYRLPQGLPQPALTRGGWRSLSERAMHTIYKTTKYETVLRPTYLPLYGVRLPEKYIDGVRRLGNRSLWPKLFVSVFFLFLSLVPLSSFPCCFAQTETEEHAGHPPLPVPE